MNVDLHCIPFDQIEPRGLLVVRAEGAELDGDHPIWATLHARLAEWGTPEVNLLGVERSTDIIHIPESLLNAEGWYKRAAESVPQAPTASTQ